jgi:hypothetical protein
MAAAILPIANLASSILGGFMGSNANNRAAGLLANTQYGAANDITASTGAGQGMVAQGGNDAITAVNNATTNANQTLTDSLGRQTQNLNPYLQAGQTGANALTNSINNPARFTVQDWMNDPGYQFLLEQGNQAINNSAAARGSAVGGNALKDLTRFGQGLAATEYQSAFDRFMASQNQDLNRINAATGAGLTASGQFNNAEQNAGNQIATNTVNAGRYQGDTNQSVAQFLANLGLQGTNLANQYRIGGANSQAAGILGKANTITGAVNQGVQALPQLLGSLPQPGGQPLSAQPIGQLPLTGFSGGLRPWQPGQ